MSPAGLAPPANVPVAVLGVGLLALAVLAVQRPPLTRTTALAVAPWAVAGALVHVVGHTGGYPPALRPYTGPAAVAVGTAGLAVLCWAPQVHLSGVRARAGDPATYLAASGVGATVVLFTVLVLRGLSLSPAAVLWLTLAPVVAGALGGVGYFLLGLRAVDALAYTRFAGLFAVVAQTLDGIALALSLAVFGGDVSRPLLTPVLAATAVLPVPAAATVVALKLGFGLVVVATVAGAAREGREWPFAALAVVGGVGLGAAVATLLVTAGGG